MEHHATSEEMPTLYRAVLDTVWRLERVGERDYALKARRRAVHTYSTRWDEGGRAELRKINRDALRRLTSTSPAVGFSLEVSAEPS